MEVIPESGKAPLPKAVLGRTDLEVTRLGYGAAFRKRISEEHADRLLNEVIDAGVNFLDTSNDYLDSEIRIGLALSHRYGEIHLSTKCGCTERREPHHVNGSIARSGGNRTTSTARFMSGPATTCTGALSRAWSASTGTAWRWCSSTAPPSRSAREAGS